MFTFLFVISLIATIVSGIVTIVNIAFLPYFISVLLATIFFFVLKKLSERVDNLEKDLADSKYRIKKLEDTDTKKEITDLRYKMKRLEEAVAKKEQSEKKV